MTWFERTYAVTPADRLSQVIALGFDAAVLETWAALAAGATLVLADDELRLDPSAFARWLVDERVTIACTPTAIGEALLDQAWPAETSLRVVYLGGERLTRRPDARTPFRVDNCYGPSSRRCR